MKSAAVAKATVNRADRKFILLPLPVLARRYLTRDKLIYPEAVFFVPVLDRKLRVFVEFLVAAAEFRLHPSRLVLQHEVDFRRRHGKLRVDRGSERMYKLRPAGIERPQRRAALRTEIPPCRACGGAAVLVPKARPPDGHRFLAAHFERPGVAHDVDRVSAAAGRLAADRAIAELVW